jgi:hypothetical protein
MNQIARIVLGGARFAFLGLALVVWAAAMFHSPLWMQLFVFSALLLWVSKVFDLWRNSI